MKSGGGRRDRAGLLRVNGLIAFGVGVFIAPGDVGRQGDVAVTLLKPIGVRGGEADPEGSVPVAGLDFAGGRPFPRLEHHVPGSAFGVERLHEEELEFRSGRIAVAPGVHSPPEHARVVVDQGVAGVEVVENRWKWVDFTGAGDAVEDQHA